jgi:hypothetical protein
MPQIFSNISSADFQILVWKIEEPLGFFETFPEHIDILDYMTLNNLRATFDY